MQTVNAGESGEQRESTYIIGGTENWYSHCEETVWRALKKTKNRATIRPNNPTPKHISRTVQFSSLVQSCLNLDDPMQHVSPPCLPPTQKSTQTHVHQVSDAIQPSHPLLSPSPPTLNLFQHQSLFKWVSSLHQVAKVLEFQLQHQSFQWILGTDFI